MPGFGFLVLEFENNIVILEISTLEFAKLLNFTKTKCLYLISKMPEVGIFEQKCLV